MYIATWMCVACHPRKTWSQEFDCHQSGVQKAVASRIARLRRKHRRSYRSAAVQTAGQTQAKVPNVTGSSARAQSGSQHEPEMVSKGCVITAKMSEV